MMTSVNKNIAVRTAFWMVLTWVQFYDLPDHRLWYNLLSLGFVLMNVALLGSELKEYEYSRNLRSKVANGPFAYIMTLHEEFGA